MTPLLVLAQLLDLPGPFIRPGPAFQALARSMAAAGAWYAQASDGIPASVSAATAAGPWLSAWGEIMGVPRLPSEADAALRQRIQQTLSAPVGTPEAVQAWSRYFLDSASIFVAENLPKPGYTISIPAGLSTALLADWIQTLGRIRPAGVPVVFQSQSGPLMLGTYSYLGALGFAGAYLGSGTQALPVSIPASTGNSQPLLPDVLLLDPALNGGLALPYPAG